MAELPCKDKADKMNKAMEDYEFCFEEVDNQQVTLTLGGSLAVVACASVLPAADTGSSAAAVKAIAVCQTSSATAFTSFILWLSKIDRCNDLVFDAYKLAKEFEKCAAEHKDVLNAAAAANAANS